MFGTTSKHSARSLAQSSNRIQCNVTIDWPENWLKKLFSNKNNNLIALYVVLSNCWKVNVCFMGQCLCRLSRSCDLVLQAVEISTDYCEDRHVNSCG